MIVVADATPFRYLVPIGGIDILRQLYTRVIIPVAVREELSHSRSPESVRRYMADAPAWNARTI